MTASCRGMRTRTGPSAARAHRMISTPSSASNHSRESRNARTRCTSVVLDHGIEMVQASSTDVELLRTLERAFERHAGGDDRIDLAYLQRALGLKSEYLASRVLAAFDRDGNGVITKDEFLAGVRALVFGTPREKLEFAFRLHD